jgi:hypothetical protein
MRPRHYELRWGLVAMVALVLALSFAAHFQTRRAMQLTEALSRVDLVTAMRTELLTAAEAEGRAVMATDPGEIQRDSSEAHAALATLEAQHAKLAASAAREPALLSQFDHAFADYERLDATVADLAARRTDTKAYALAFGPLREALTAADVAVSAIVDDAVSSPPARGEKIIAAATTARASLLRMGLLVGPHIAEQSEDAMDLLEKQMAEQQAAARHALDALRPLVPPTSQAQLGRLEVAYTRIIALQGEIITLSRDHTNARAVAMTLHQKRSATLACLDALDALARAARTDASALKKPSTATR